MKDECHHYTEPCSWRQAPSTSSTRQLFCTVTLNPTMEPHHVLALVSFRHIEVPPKLKFLLNTKLKALSEVCIGWWLSSSLQISFAQVHLAFRYIAVMDAEVKDSGDRSYWEFHGYFCRQNLGKHVCFHYRLLLRIGTWVMVIDRWSSFTLWVNESAPK